jgi:hypothetical protein
MRSAIIMMFVIALTTGCGVASVAPYLGDSDVRFDTALVGTWQDSEGKESAMISADGSHGYRIVYRENDGKSGTFVAKLGVLGRYRVLDVQPDDPAPGASAIYRSLLLPAHGLLVIDSIGRELTFRLIEADSLEAFLERRPSATPHTRVDGATLLTGSTGEVRRFLLAFLQQPNVVTQAEVWRRLSP